MSTVSTLVASRQGSEDSRRAENGKRNKSTLDLNARAATLKQNTHQKQHMMAGLLSSRHHAIDEVGGTSSS